MREVGEVVRAPRPESRGDARRFVPPAGAGKPNHRRRTALRVGEWVARGTAGVAAPAGLSRWFGVVLLATGSAVAQDAELRSYDVRALVACEGAVSSGESLALPTGWSIPTAGGFAGVESSGLALARAGVSEDQIARLVGEIVATSLDAIEGGWVDCSDGILRVAATAAVHTEVERCVALLEAHYLRRVALVLHELSGPNLIRTARGVLDREQVRALLVDARETRSFATSLLIDTGHRLESGRYHGYLRDYDVEVAQKSYIADPKADLLFAGQRFVVGVVETPERRLQVTVASARTAVETPIRTSPASIPRGGSGSLEGRADRETVAEMGSVQLPRVGVESFVGSAVVEDGGGLAFGSSEADGRVWLLELRRADERPATTALPDVEVVPIGSLLGGALRFHADSLRPEPPEQDSIERRDPELPGSFRGRLDALLAEADDGDSAIHVIGNGMLLRGAAGFRARVRELLRQVAAGRDRTATVHLAIGTVEPDVARDVVRGRLAATELAGTLPRRAVVATLIGDRFRIQVGTEGSYLGDWVVEIAQGAAIGNPVVARWFDGYALEGAVSRLQDGRVKLSARLEYSVLHATSPPDLGETRGIGNIETPLRAFVEQRQDLIAEASGQWQVFCIASLAEEDTALAALVRVDLSDR